MLEALQLCPNDHPPFVDVCAGHAQAIARLGYRVSTVFFESRGFAHRPNPGFEFAFLPAEKLPDVVDRSPQLLVSHRYRAYRAGVDLVRRRAIPRHIAIAHEFGLFGPFSRRLRRRLAGDAGVRFAGVSEPVADDLRSTGIVSPGILPNPIDDAALRRQLLPRSTARAELGIPASAFAIAVIGRLHPKKDPARALRAFDRYRREDVAARLVFLGDGKLREGLQRDAGDGVIFAGFRADARALLGAFDMLLACSTEREAFGLALLEAMAAAVPVVCADRPGPRYVLGGCGAYFTTEAELVAALRTMRNGSAAVPGYDVRAQRRIARCFSIEALAGRYRELLAP